MSTHLDTATGFAQISLMHPPNQQSDSELRYEEGDTRDVSRVELWRCIRRIRQVRHPCTLRVRQSIHQCQHNRSLFCVAPGNFTVFTVSVDHIKIIWKESLLGPCVRQRPIRRTESIHFESDPFQADWNIPNGENNRGEQTKACTDTQHERTPADVIRPYCEGYCCYDAHC
jgi:hypothetical protein